MSTAKGKQSQKGTLNRKTPSETTEVMVAALAHEIKNPLNSMKGAAQYLHEKYESRSDIKEFTGLIIDEIARLERYLNEFMSFSRGMKLRPVRTDVTSFLTGVVMLVKHGFPGRIDFISPGKKLPEIDIDQEQIRQVIVNLFSNAKDAMTGITCPRVALFAVSDSMYVRISLRDNGCGIKKEQLKSVFEPFYSTKSTGIGIGLAISRSIVKKHGGTIKVKSKPGEGTVFTVSLPIRKGGRENG